MAQEEKTSKINNTVTIEDAGPCKKKVIIEIPQEAIKEATNEQYTTLGKDAEVPGFRKGRAPRRLLEKRFGKNIAEQVKLKLLADSSDEAVKDNKLDILGEPDIDYENIELPEEDNLKYEFEVEVRPEFQLPELEAIPVNKVKIEVTDEQVDREVEQLAKWSGIWTPRDQGAQVELDDQIIADAVIKFEDLEEEEKLDNTEVYIRAQGFIGSVPVEDLDSQLAGAKVGDEKQMVVNIPQTYFKAEYQGKKADIKLEIKDIKWLKPADIDDEFVKRFEVDTVDELRERIRDNLTGKIEQQIRGDMADQIYKYMLDNTDFDLPMDIVADQAQGILARQQISLMQRGMNKEQITEQMQQLRAGSEEQAKQQLKQFFIMDKVAEKLEIDVTDEEVNGHIAQLAIQQGTRPEKMREEMVRNGSLAQFTLQVRSDKCVAKLLESAKVTEVEPEKEPKTEKKTPKKTAKKSRKKTTKKAAESEKKTTKKATKKTAKKTSKKTDSNSGKSDDKKVRKTTKKKKTSSKKKTE